MVKKLIKIILILSLAIILLIIVFTIYKFYLYERGEYKKVSYKSVKNWGNDYDLASFITAFKDSCNVFKLKSDNTIITSSPKITTAISWKNICNKLSDIDLANNNSIKDFIENNFIVYRAGNKNTSHVTGYYRIELSGSLEKTGEYKYPIYKKPEDLVQVNLGDFMPNLKGQIIFGRVDSRGRLVKYYSRQEIENGVLTNKNLAIVWLKSKYEAFLLHVQGSGIVDTTSGEKIYLSYAAKNGLQFSGITSYMKQNNYKSLNPDLRGIEATRDFFDHNQDKVDEVLNNNNSFIFFQKVNQKNWVGAFNTNLYAQRTVAVDPNYEALGIPLWLTIKNPDTNEKISRMVVSNDIGSAIKGIGRVDFYWGLGKEAGDLASITNQYTTLYMFLPKD
ncbi:MltA domain-containing protein [Rickettsiales bacterium LUAb2]